MPTAPKRATRSRAPAKPKTPPTAPSAAAAKPPKMTDLDVVTLARKGRVATAGGVGIVALACTPDGEPHVRAAMFADSTTAWFRAVELLDHANHERPAVVRIEPSGMAAVHVDNPREVNPTIVDLNLGEAVAGDQPDDDEHLDLDL